MAECASALFFSFSIFLAPRCSSGPLVVAGEDGGSWPEKPDIGEWRGEGKRRQGEKVRNKGQFWSTLWFSSLLVCLVSEIEAFCKLRLTGTCLRLLPTWAFSSVTSIKGLSRYLIPRWLRFWPHSCQWGRCRHLLRAFRSLMQFWRKEHVYVIRSTD